MGYSSGGKVTFVDRGVYDDTVTYYRLNYVKHYGAIFVCKKTTLGNAPNLTTDTEYWTKFIEASGAQKILYDSTGNTVTARDGLQFMNGSLQDDAQGNKTKVTIGITDSEWATIQTLLGTATP